jgi:ABC-type antimicrobial peptide transport system, ATPase component
MIECKNITKVYQTGAGEGAKVLKGVSFSIENGEFVAIIGPSGSGKSTLMHILGMLDTPTSGDYFLDGKNVAGYSDDDLAEIRKNKIGFRVPIVQSFAACHGSAQCLLATGYAGVEKIRARREGARRAGEGGARPGTLSAPH